ncbi:terpenoid cyclases/protein prenyltransferase alpha-alpha toroid [Lactifluus subvellereus]|nr:terpenoid cyclases/protein prenyltransferase alpha-alpha toroid [Lactifluus subvellereus]
MEHKEVLDADKTIEYVMRCQCWDNEAGHDAHIFSTLSAIRILATHDALVRIDVLRVIDCAESHAAQAPARTAALEILDRLDMIDVPTLRWWLAERQLPSPRTPRGNRIGRVGASRTGRVDMADVFHTLFGVAGLSLLGYPELDDVDLVYCMPTSLIERMGLKKSWKALPRREA